MKTELSSLELNYIIRELQDMMSAKVEQVYQIGKDELIFQFHVPNAGKRILRLILGKAMYLTSNKGDIPEKPPGFCLYLRKRLKNARLRSISQMGFDRIVEFVFETKESKFKLIVELFSKGNIIMCDEQNIILSVLERKEWKDRSIKPKEGYKNPEKEFNLLTITRDELADLLHKSDKENLVKTMALDLGIGGVYSEELCIISGVDKSLKSVQLSDKEIDSIHKAITIILQKDISPVVYRDAAGKIKDIVPFALEFYRDFTQTTAESFNAALDSVLTPKVEKKAMETAEKAAGLKLGKIDEIISQQNQRIDGLEKSQLENQRKGEIVYENYPLVQQILDEIIELRKTLSWKEVQEHFKGHKIIKSVDVATGEITLEL